jgi:hypothetical protein
MSTMHTTTDTRTAKLVRGLVKTIFVLCYMAYMWASIHHMAAFFNDFEADTGNTWGSYLLARVFDITALVTTIGVMFFRKSMPGWVFWIVWAFILAIAGYSFFINWEYASHYQNMTLLLQPTGATTAVYDTHGALHYVPVMQVNTRLVWVNPILASGFTIFSLIYSVIAEFFGTKAPTVEELRARKKYLEETSSVLEDIRTSEEKHRKPSLIQRAKEAAMEAKTAAQELFSTEETPVEDAIEERETDELARVEDEINGISEEEERSDQSRVGGGQDEHEKSIEHPVLAGLSGRATLPIERAAAIIGCEIKHVQALRNQGKLKHAPKAKNMITVASIKSYIAMRRKPRINPPTSEQRPDLKVVV